MYHNSQLYNYFDQQVYFFNLFTDTIIYWYYSSYYHYHLLSNSTNTTTFTTAANTTTVPLLLVLLQLWFYCNCMGVISVGLCSCMRVCACMCMCSSVCVFVRVGAGMYMLILICLCLHDRTHINPAYLVTAQTSKHDQTCSPAHMNAHTHTHRYRTHTHKHVRACEHTHTYTYSLSHCRSLSIPFCLGLFDQLYWLADSTTEFTEHKDTLSLSLSLSLSHTHTHTHTRWAIRGWMEKKNIEERSCQRPEVTASEELYSLVSLQS